MPQADKNQVEVGLALQGGGALGAYECGAVTALLELMDGAEASGRSIKLQCVAGVSIGAINAACVVGAESRADARRRLAALWDDLTLETPSFWPPEARRDLALFGLPGFYAPGPTCGRFPRGRRTTTPASSSAPSSAMSISARSTPARRRSLSRPST